MAGKRPLQPRCCRRQNIGDIDRLGLGAERAGFKPRHVEKIADKTVQPFGLFADGPQNLLGAVHIVKAQIGQKRGRRAQDRGQRRAQIVAERTQHRHPQFVGLRQHRASSTFSARIARSMASAL